MTTPGTLHIVATPLGNLDDITLRALRVLREVDVVACEDTRHSAKLLRHHGIRAPQLLSVHAHNEARRVDTVCEILAGGRDVALISDAGTPCLSDPGAELVAGVAGAGYDVVPVPGPSAAIAALSAAGLPTGRVRFEGFLPRATGARRERLERLGRRAATLVVYESPRRVLALLDDVVAALGAQRPVCVARELTKLYEELLRGPAAQVRDELAARDEIRGEITVLIGGAPSRDEGGDQALAIRRRELAARLARRLLDEGLSARSTRDVLADLLELGGREAYDLVLAIRDGEDS